MFEIYNNSQIKSLLEYKQLQYNNSRYIIDDPISIPHLFNSSNDIEISAFFASMLAWGKRSAIISKLKLLMSIMDNSPHEFILNYSQSDYNLLDKFVYRTFNSDDLLFVIGKLKMLLLKYHTLGDFFAYNYNHEPDVKYVLTQFHNFFFHDNISSHAKKHISNPGNGSASKRLNMFLRWMVRKDNTGFDFGLWDFIPTSKLFIPLDVHVSRVARKLNLLSRKSNDWKAVVELTNKLSSFDENDPVKYDFALFGLGVYEKFGYE